MRMRRREVIAGLGGAVAWPLAARAQRPAVPVIGLLSGAALEGFYAPMVDEIRHGLNEAGFVEGQNVIIEYRVADGRPELVRDLVGDLVRRRVAVIVAIAGSNTALAAKAITSTIPIVFATGGDAVENGLVKDLRKPEANVTGMSFSTRQLGPKRLDLLRELVPQATSFGYLDNVATESESARKDLEASARSIGRSIVVFYAGSEQEIEGAFQRMVQQGIQALLISPDAYLVTRRDQIVALAKLHALPTIYPGSGSITAGGLMSYEIRSEEMYRQAGIYTGRILKGAKIADLPVQLPTKFSLGINLKTAKALGITVPPNLLALVDEVVE